MAPSKKRVATKLSAASNKAAQMKKSAADRKAAAAVKGGAQKKLGLQNSETRTALLDATEQLLREQGFAAITSRTIAEKAGLKFQLIFYYFNSMDDLYVEVFRRGAEADLERLEAAKKAKNPVRAMWKLTTDPKAARFTTEFITIANHIDAVRAEISRYAKKRREVQAEIIEQQLAARGGGTNLPPIIIAFLLENVAKGLLLESALDLSLGHAEVKAWADACLRLMEEAGDPSGAASVSMPAQKPRAPRKAAKTSAASSSNP